MSDQKNHEPVSDERLTAIINWHLPKYSTGVYVTRAEEVSIAAELLELRASHAAAEDEYVKLKAKYCLLDLEHAALLEQRDELAKRLTEVVECFEYHEVEATGCFTDRLPINAKFQNARAALPAKEVVAHATKSHI